MARKKKNPGARPGDPSEGWGESSHSHAPEPTFYLFDGHNLLFAGKFVDPRELEDRLAGFVALKGARGVVVFDGFGERHTLGPLEVRFAEEADFVLERLAAELRESERVCLVSSDLTVRETSGRQVDKRSSQLFMEELEEVELPPPPRMAVEDRLDPKTRAKLERIRRGEE
ncbi:MAG: NYN domain-containing protein [Gaiellaceae bacterium]